MMAEDVVVAVLLSKPEVIGLIDQRIFLAGKAPQDGALPYVTYQRISSTGGDVDLEGDADPDVVRVQVNCWDAAFGGDARRLAQRSRHALHGYAGRGAQLITCEAPRDAAPEEQLKLEGVLFDAFVIMNEAAEAA